MCAAAAAVYFHPRHSITVVRYFFYVLRIDGLVKAGPTGAALKLGVGAEKSLVATNAIIRSFPVIVPGIAGISRFRSFFPGNIILQRSELLAPFCIRFGNRIFPFNIVFLTLGIAPKSSGNYQKGGQ
jgi:hypothetical protein